MFYSHTVVNRWIVDGYGEGSISGHLRQGAGTYQEALMEFAARNCYHSFDRMGTAPGFIAQIVGRRHMDVIEHVTASVRMAGSRNLALLNNNLTWEPHQGSEFLITGNLRCWYDILKAGHSLPSEFHQSLRYLAPKVFGLPRDGVDCNIPRGFGASSVAPVKANQATVTMLAYTAELDGSPSYSTDAAYTFLIEGISLAAAPHLTRHRKASISQRSLRYTTVRDQGYIVPDSLKGKRLLTEAYHQHMVESFHLYEKLLEDGVRKEDARYVLPASVKTDIVVTMSARYWLHFLELRTAKAAQWEIRAIANAVKGLIAKVGK